MGLKGSKFKRNPNNPMEVRITKKQQDAERQRNREKRKEKERLAKEKRGKKGGKLKNANPPIAPDRPPPTIKPTINIKETDYDMQAKVKLQTQLARDSSTFILNQLMMSVQFFGNYEREMSDAMVRNRKLENEKIEKIAKHCKSVIIPDRLHDTVDRRVKFMARHGSTKNQIQSLHTQTLYIIHENIEIIKPSESDYSTVIGDKPLYRMKIDMDGKFNKVNNKLHTGYFKLKGLEVFRKKNREIREENAPKNRPRDSIFGTEMPVRRLTEYDEDDDEEDDDDDDIPPPITTYRPKFRDSIMVQRPKNFKTNDFNNITSPRTTTSVTPSPPSSEYDYAYITALNTHQPLSVMRSSNQTSETLSTTTLPESCFTNVQVKVPSVVPQDSDFDSDDEEFEFKQAFSSKNFLTYFINMFQNSLASDLGFSKEDLEKATWKGAVIYIPNWEIIPAIPCDWPEKEGEEWLTRHRDISENLITTQKYQWPTPQMINKIKGLGCHVVPIGYTPKVGTNPDREFEWKLVFPSAEQYLESCLTNAQVKIYMMAKALIKTFVEPNIDQKYNMFTTEHLRTHLFWLCENNYGAWPEDYLGEVLLRFLNSLLDRISTHKLADYFLPQRNLFENIPEKILFELHKRIFRITENPAMYVMIAMRNLKMDSKYYPKLKYKRLLKAVIIDNPLKITNPNLCNANNTDDIADDSGDEADTATAMGVIGYFEKKAKEKPAKRNRVVRFKQREDPKEVTPRKVSVESIDTSFYMNRYMEPMRRQLIFDTFILQFLEMAKISGSFRSLYQAMIYLKQVERLCGILHDDQVLQSMQMANGYLEVAQAIRTKIVEAMERENYAVPILPRRESMLEPKLRARLPSIKPPSEKPIPEENDPYTNIETLKRETLSKLPDIPKLPAVIEPASFTDSSDEENDIIQKAPPSRNQRDNTYQRKKIMLMNGGGGNHNKQQQQVGNGIVKSVQIIEKVQIHQTDTSLNESHTENSGDNNNDDNALSDTLGNIGGNKQVYNNSNNNDNSDKITIINKRPSVTVKSLNDLLRNEKNQNTIILLNGHATEHDDNHETSF